MNKAQIQWFQEVDMRAALVLCDLRIDCLDKEQAKAVLASVGERQFGGKDFVFERIAPVPDDWQSDLCKTLSLGADFDKSKLTIRDWRRLNWGVATRCGESSLSVSKDNPCCVRGWFYSDVSVPVALLCRLSERFPDATVVVDANYGSSGESPDTRHVFEKGRCANIFEFRMVWEDEEGNTYRNWEDAPEEVRASGELRSVRDEHLLRSCMSESEKTQE